MLLLPTASRGVPAQAGIAGGEHEAAGLPEDPAPDERHHQPWQDRREEGAEPQQRVVDQTERGGDPLLGDQCGEVLRGAARFVQPQHLVGEALHQLASALVADQVGEPALPTSFSCGHVALGIAQDPLGQCHGTLDPTPVDVLQRIRSARHSSTVAPCRDRCDHRQLRVPCRWMWCVSRQG